jgi:hypothetical protein
VKEYHFLVFSRVWVLLPASGREPGRLPGPRDDDFRDAARALPEAPAVTGLLVVALPCPAPSRAETGRVARKKS